MVWDGNYGFSSLSEKTRKSNHLQKSLPRQHFLLSYFKDPECWSSRVLNSQLSRPTLFQLSLPGSVQMITNYKTNLRLKILKCSQSPSFLLSFKDFHFHLAALKEEHCLKAGYHQRQSLSLNQKSKTLWSSEKRVSILLTTPSLMIN